MTPGLPEAPDEAADLPAFPTPGVRSRITELGYGSGPWTRQDFAERWGDALASKVITEAKGLGWLISPFRGQFYVPPARDLMVAAWLPSRQRTEFVISRTFAATGLRYWCLSAWARNEGLLFSEPLFVTDLTAAREPPRVRPGETLRLEDLAAESRRRAKDIASVPYLENVIIVTALGELGPKWLRARVNLTAGPQRLPRKDLGEGPLGPATEGRGDEGRSSPTLIEYDVSPLMADQAWAIAFLNALSLPRVREKLLRLVQAETRDAKGQETRPARKGEDLMARAMRWGAYFGPPTLNDGWKSLLASGGAPYLLIPPALWDETISVSTSRRSDDMARLRRGPGA